MAWRRKKGKHRVKTLSVEQLYKLPTVKRRNTRGRSK